MTPPPASPAPRPPSRLPALWICLLLAAITLAVYWPVTGYEFVGYDDSDFVTANPIVQAGVTLRGLQYAMHAEVARNWHPVTLCSHMLDCQIFGLRAGGHHLTSLLLHTANTLLLFLVLKRMTGALWRSALVAALFAWHPLHVESVAWVAERKDVLSALFWWLTLWAWLCHVDASKNPGPKSKLFYILAVVLFILAAMSKPMVVTLPCVLLLLDFWPLGRFRLGAPPPPAQAGRAKSRPAPPLVRPAASLLPPWRLLLEKIPFFVISAALCCKTFLVQKSGGAMLDTANLPLASRLGNAVISYVRYPAKMFWPGNLSALYIRTGDWPAWEVAGAALLLAGLTAWMVAQSRRRPWLALGWFWYAGMLVPVIGLVQVGMQTMADRYTYLPLVGLFIILAWGGADLAARYRPPKYVPALLATFSLGACLVLTGRQIPCWQNSETLFKKMIAVTDKNYMAHFNLGNYYSRQGKTDLALANYQAALAAEPNYAEAHNNLAGLFLDRKLYDQGIQHYQDAARLKPSATAWFNLANAFADAGRARRDTNLFAQSVQAYQQSLKLDPDSIATRNNFGMVWQDQDRNDLAIPEFQAAVQVKADFELGHFNLANSLARSGRLDEAIAHYQTAARLNPGRVEAYNGQGLCYARQGKMEEAARQFRRVTELNPGDSGVWENLGNALGSQNKLDEAIPCFLKALQIDPRNYEAEFNLGLSLLHQNRRDEARTHFQAALRIQPDYPAARQALSELDRPAK
ncbi:MAG: tetratricopeptide repeat protein [Verrucomicrobiota bacterium]